MPPKKVTPPADPPRGAGSGKTAGKKKGLRATTEQKKKGKASLKTATTKQAREDILVKAREARRAQTVDAARQNSTLPASPSTSRNLASVLRSATSPPPATPPPAAPPSTPTGQPALGQEEEITPNADNTNTVDPKLTGSTHHIAKTYFEFNVELGENTDPSGRYIALIEEILLVLHKIDPTAALIPLSGKGPSVGSTVPLPDSITALQNYIDITTKTYKFDEEGEEKLYGILWLGHAEDAQTLRQKTELELSQQKLFMYIKEVQAQKTGKCMMLFCVNNTLCIKALQTDIKEQLKKIAAEHNMDQMEDEDKENRLSVPEFSIRLSKAWLKIANNDKNKGKEGKGGKKKKKGKYVHNPLARLQKICQLECSDDVADDLIAVATEWKRKGGVQATCGKHAHLSACLNADASPREWKLLHRFNRNNTDFNGSTLLNPVEGLSDPDKEVEFTRDDDTIYAETVKDIFLGITVDENMPLFLAMHNRNGGDPELCYPEKSSYVELAERVLAHPASWIYHVFKDQWSEEEMKEVLKAFDDDARAEVSSSIFDEDTLTVCTPESKKEDEHCESFEAEGWRVDMTKVKTNTGNMEERPNKNAVVSFNFEDGASVGTIHQGTPTEQGAEVDNMSTSTLGTMRSAADIESKRKENELLAEVAALKERLKLHTVEDQPDLEIPNLDEEKTGDPSGNGIENPVTPDKQNQEAGLK